MFYDHELGEAFYSSPAGKINGTISLKRQYRIRKGKIEYMIESSVTVHDDILQKNYVPMPTIKWKYRHDNSEGTESDHP